MSGRFEELSDLEWKLFEDLLSEPAKPGKGMPHVPFRYIINTLLYILITGCRWCGIPRGEHWASKSSAHQWLKHWEQDGTLTHLQQRVLNLAQESGLMHWEYGDVEGSFSPWKGWR